MLEQRREEGWGLAPDDEPDAPPRSEAAISYATLLVRGIQDRCADLDALIERFAVRWALDRMPVIDKNVLRLALFELVAVPDVPTPVVINEAIELVKSLSTEESGRFINGILGRAAQELR